MTVVENLERIKEIKENIKSAIEEKGVAMVDVPFYDYPNKVRDISGGGKINVAELGVKFSHSTFVKFPHSNFDFTGCEDWLYMFSCCDSFKDGSGLDFNDVKYADMAFELCEELDLRTLGVRDGSYTTIEMPNLEDGQRMFNRSCIYGSDFYSVILRLPNVQNLYATFNQFGTGVVSFYIYSPKCTDYSYMFENALIDKLYIDEIAENANLDSAFRCYSPDGVFEAFAMGGNMNCNSMLEGARFNEVTLSGNWADANFDSSTFHNLTTSKLQISAYKNGDLDVSTVNGLSIESCKILIRSVGTADTTHHLIFPSNIEYHITDEDVEVALSKNWIISFA